MRVGGFAEIENLPHLAMRHISQRVKAWSRRGFQVELNTLGLGWTIVAPANTTGQGSGTPRLWCKMKTRSSALFGSGMTQREPKTSLGMALPPVLP